MNDFQIVTRFYKKSGGGKSLLIIVRLRVFIKDYWKTRFIYTTVCRVVKFNAMFFSKFW